MRKNIHPEYFKDATITCACGAKFSVGSTKPQMRVEICSQCHPFFTGSQKFIDSAGRLERFKAKIAKATKTDSKSK